MKTSKKKLTESSHLWQTDRLIQDEKKTLKNLRWDHTVWFYSIKLTITAKWLLSAEDKNDLMVLAKHFTTLRRLKTLRKRISQVLICTDKNKTHIMACQIIQLFLSMARCTHKCSSTDKEEVWVQGEWIFFSFCIFPQTWIHVN